VFHQRATELDSGGEPVGELFILSGEAPVETSKTPSASNGTDEKKNTAEQEDDDFEIVEPQVKRAKPTEDDDDDDIVEIVG